MFDKNEAQYQLGVQPGIRQKGASPSGLLIPGEMAWNVTAARDTQENQQVQADGFEREFVLGNWTSRAGGNVIYNLNLLPHWIKALCSSITSSAFTGIYQINVTSKGSGYTTPPTVTLTGGGGTGAIAVPVILGGQVQKVVIVNPGTGYATAPTVGFTGGGGTGAAATAVIDLTKFKHYGKLAPGAPLYHWMEKGVKGETYWRVYLDMVLRKLAFSDKITGICSVTDEWVGSGEMEKSATSIDGTPAEITGTPGEYRTMCLLEGGAVAGILTELNTDIEISLREKRPDSADGKATELRKGGVTVRGGAKAYFENEVLATKAENGTLTSTQSVITTADGVFYRTEPEVKFEFGDWERTEDNGLEINLNRRSIKKTGANGTCEFLVVNGTASYPN